MRAELCGANPVESPCLTVHIVLCTMLQQRLQTFVEAAEQDALRTSLNLNISFG